MRRFVFWIDLSLILFTHFGYAGLLALLRALGLGRSARRFGDGAALGAPADGDLPKVTLVVAAYDEEDVIAGKVENALALDYPREKLEVIVASDGSGDATVTRAEEAGADKVLDLPRQGKSLTQNAAVERASGEVLAFSDANCLWESDALRHLVAAFDDPEVAYACGELSYLSPEGDNQEGLYWDYELAVRELESDFGGITAGNGGIYAVRRDDYIPLGPAGSHDLSFPFQLAKRGRRSVFVREAHASERMVPTTEGEWQRKRRMMVGLWDIVMGEGMISPKGYRPMYGFQIYSHRVLRYLTPWMHVELFLATLALRRSGRIYRLALAAQLGLLGAAAVAKQVQLAPFRVARYYVMMTASIAAGVWDRLRRGEPGGTWEKSDGTR